MQDRKTTIEQIALRVKRWRSRQKKAGKRSAPSEGADDPKSPKTA